ncbi:uncharacterized protein N7473_001632 [Penicillium subrubescens]|uniref:uncharacterized protein n=1 Tax=Penicillium subrubescens TaxID=1316194 RepID=UPI0025458102|nr:uncharacterized protein N7473_001632 [Penicillium subrubescens]KAJ5904716.1 hypothetical protein N7473_001632 [Penicillium subrubescens]
MTSLNAGEDFPDPIIIPDESDTQNIAAASDSTQTAGRPLSTSGYVEATGVLVGLNTSAQGASTSRKRKRTKLKELSDLVCPSFVA